MKKLKWLWIIGALIIMSLFLWGCSDNAPVATIIVSHDASYKAPCAAEWYITKMDVQGDTANFTAVCAKQTPANEV